MPQLVKGGKYVFGWSLVGLNGEIHVPPEALQEYGLTADQRVILISGSKTSGGFGITTLDALCESPLGSALDTLVGLKDYSAPEGQILKHKQRVYCWAYLRKGLIKVPPKTLTEYGITPGNQVLTARGSGLAIGFLVRGPIIKEAQNHPELLVY